MVKNLKIFNNKTKVCENFLYDNRKNDKLKKFILLIDILI
jgi:hypothetical protein